MQLHNKLRFPGNVHLQWLDILSVTCITHTSSQPSTLSGTKYVGQVMTSPSNTEVLTAFAKGIVSKKSNNPKYTPTIHHIPKMKRHCSNTLRLTLTMPSSDTVAKNNYRVYVQ